MLDIVSDDEDSGYTSKNQTESLPTTGSVPDIAAAESSSVCIHVKQWGESDSVIILCSPCSLKTTPKPRKHSISYFNKHTNFLTTCSFLVMYFSSNCTLSALINSALLYSSTLVFIRKYQKHQYRPEGFKKWENAKRFQTRRFG